MRNRFRQGVLPIVFLTVFGLLAAACGTETDAPEGAGEVIGETEDPAADGGTEAGTEAGTEGGGAESAAAPGFECQGEEGEYLIGMSQANVAEPYREVMDSDIAAAAEEVPQFEVAFADAAQDNSKQVSDVENFMTQGIDLLIISPNEAAPLTSVVAEAYESGIPVVVLDRRVEGDQYTTWIGADNTEIGRAAGEFIAEELLPDGGNVVELQGLPGSTPAQERSDGFHEAIEGRDDIEVVATGVGDWLRDLGREEFQAILQATPDIDVVYSHNDPMAEGAYLAAEAAGRADEIEFTGIDALPIPSGGIKAVEEGRLAATFVYPTGGREAIEAAQTILLDCEVPPKEQVLETQIVTEENAAQVYEELGGTD